MEYLEGCGKTYHRSGAAYIGMARSMARRAVMAHQQASFDAAARRARRWFARRAVAITPACAARIEKYLINKQWRRKPKMAGSMAAGCRKSVGSWLA